MAVKEKKDKKTVAVGVEALWRAMAKDTVTVIPKIMPSIVRSIEVIEGDGGLGSVLLFNLGDHHVESKRKQTEKIVELDDSEYRFALKVLEGPALTLRNFSALTTSFQLSKIGEQETLVDMKVVYETEKEEANNTGDIALKPAISYIQFLEKYVLES